MEAATIKRLSKEALEDSIAHGYRDHETAPDRICTKAMCEVAEAVSAFRDNKLAKVRGFIRSNQINDKQSDHPSHDDNFMTNYRARMKDSVQDELADVVIYLLILISKFDDQDIPDISKERYKIIPDDFVMAAGQLMRYLTICTWPAEVFNAVRAIDYIERWMYHVTGDDLEWCVEQKMKFNKLRPYRHGRKDDPTL